MTSLSSYSVLAGDYYLLAQPIEGFNSSDLNWGTANAQTITVSFWTKSSLTGTFGGAIENSAANRCYVFSYTISAANTWEQKTITIPGDQSGTWLTDNSVGLVLRFGLGVGSTYSGAAGSWGSTRYFSATGATSVVGTNGATFYLTGVQLEVGSKATAFERRPYGMELQLCQRYYRTFTLHSGPKIASAYGYPIFRFSTMRVAPTEISFKDMIGNLSRYTTVNAAGAVTHNRTSPEAAGNAGKDTDGVIITLSSDTDVSFQMYVAVGAEL